MIISIVNGLTSLPISPSRALAGSTTCACRDAQGKYYDATCDCCSVQSVLQGPNDIYCSNAGWVCPRSFISSSNLLTEPASMHSATVPRVRLIRTNSSHAAKARLLTQGIKSQVDPVGEASDAMNGIFKSTRISEVAQKF